MAGIECPNCEKFTVIMVRRRRDWPYDDEVWLYAECVNCDFKKRITKIEHRNSDEEDLIYDDIDDDW